MFGGELTTINRYGEIAKALARKAANLAPPGGMQASRIESHLINESSQNSSHRTVRLKLISSRSSVLHVTFIKWARFYVC